MLRVRVGQGCEVQWPVSSAPFKPQRESVSFAVIIDWFQASYRCVGSFFMHGGFSGATIPVSIYYIYTHNL